MQMVRKLFLLLVLTVSATVQAELPGVLRWDVAQDLESTYKNIYKSLEKSRFFVVFEPNIGANLEGFAERWGDNYNRKRLSGIRSMVFCKRDQQCRARPAVPLSAAYHVVPQGGYNKRCVYPAHTHGYWQQGNRVVKGIGSGCQQGDRGRYRGGTVTAD